jgi:hypothetical protein
MAKKYGGRWQIVDSAPLGSGGQGTVFRVTDLTMQHEGELALKRIPDTNRRGRFRRERNEDEVRAMLEEAIEVFFGHLSL